MAHASTQAMPAKTEAGAWTWVSDSSGAKAFIHVHGTYWPQHLDQLGAAVQSGQLMPHVHPDGSLHLHDM
jgi:hypothetical protein